MAASNLPGDGGDYFATIPLETENHAAAVEVAAGMIQLVLLGPVVTARTTFTRGEARSVAMSMIEASQRGQED
jgi:hypothetical protein